MLLAISGGRPLLGEVVVPGDKSISHRALILGALAKGSTNITGLGSGADVQSTAACLRRLGAEIDTHEVRRQSVTVVKGRGFRGLTEPAGKLDCGNSGTTMRLLMGVVAGHEMSADFTGDASLRRRPMKRVAEPLTRMGASVKLKAGKAPLTVKGAALKGIDFVSPVASAQLKSAVLLAGCLGEGKTSVTEPSASRDHTERMLEFFGVPVLREGLRVTVQGGSRLGGVPVRVPGDPSSAAFWAVAATLVPGSHVSLREIAANPTRTAFLDVLDRMGARIERSPWEKGVIGAPEPVMDLLVKAAPLKAADIEAEEVPALIDEVPILALAASQAEGTSRFKGLSELRHKESDRLAAVAEILTAFGARAEVSGDDLVISGPAKLRAARIDPKKDHRLAMTALVAGLLTEGQTSVEDGDCIAISYPTFYDDLKNCH